MATTAAPAVPAAVGGGAAEEAGASYKDFDKMDDVCGQAWVEDGEEVWRLSTVRSVSADGNTIFVLNTDGEWVPLGLGVGLLPAGRRPSIR